MEVKYFRIFSVRSNKLNAVELLLSLHCIQFVRISHNILFVQTGLPVNIQEFPCVQAVAVDWALAENFEQACIRVKPCLVEKLSTLEPK